MLARWMILLIFGVFLDSFLSLLLLPLLYFTDGSMRMMSGRSRILRTEKPSSPGAKMMASHGFMTSRPVS